MDPSDTFMKHSRDVSLCLVFFPFSPFIGVGVVISENPKNMPFNFSLASNPLQNHVGWQLAKKMRSPLLSGPAAKDRIILKILPQGEWMPYKLVPQGKRTEGWSLAKIPVEPLETSFWKSLKLVGGAEVILRISQKKKKINVLI